MFLIRWKGVISGAQGRFLSCACVRYLVDTVLVQDCGMRVVPFDKISLESGDPCPRVSSPTPRLHGYAPAAPEGSDLGCFLS